MTVTLYSTGCPRCKVLEKKLEQKGIVYIKPTNEEMIQASEKYGFTTVPQLKVNETMMDFKTAVNWINEEK